MTLTKGVDTYLDAAEADAHFAARGVDSWAVASTIAREAALMEATAYIDGTYRFVGHLADPAQPLAWPRSGAVDREGRRHDGGIPEKVVRACSELALIALSGPLAPPVERGGKIRSESVGPVSVAYADDAPPGRLFPYVEIILAPLLRIEDGGSVEVHRS